MVEEYKLFEERKKLRASEFERRKDKREAEKEVEKVKNLRR